MTLAANHGVTTAACPDIFLDSHEQDPSWFARRIQQPAELIYQRYFIELVLRQKPLPPSKNGRHVPLRAIHEHSLIDERRGHGYLSNSIRSSRYTFWDFLPRQLLFQCTRVHNLFFIAIGVPQTIPGLSTTGNYTTILPLTFFILLTVIKEGYDDFRRHRMDQKENNRLATLLRSIDQDGDEAAITRSVQRILSTLLNTLLLRWKATSKAALEVAEEKELDLDQDVKWTKTKWHNIKVGDILKLKRDETVPADVALLYADGENGVAFIETMALDGETNLKSKQALPALSHHCCKLQNLKHCSAEFVLEDPNKDLYDFNGKVTINEQTFPLTLSEVVLRGSVLRNTDHAIGMAINTGEECKIRMNANHHPKAKKPRLEKYANQVVLTLIIYVVILSIGLSGGYLQWHADFEVNAWYLTDAAPSFKQIIIGFLIMFNNVIPLALYVSLEIVKLGQMLMIQSDVEMFDDESNTSMTCNTNTILENLGQIGYVLTDKTGTLTENVMQFRGMSLGGVVWMHCEEPSTTSHDDTKQNHCSKLSEGKAGPKHLSDDNGVMVEEVELAGPGRDNPQPRVSQALSRPSLNRTRSTHTQRSTKELLNIMQRQSNHPMARKAREFILGLALCHTALPERAVNGEIDFQASSPDEVALVRAAQELGFLLVHRSSQRIDLQVDGKTESYEILDIIEFSSKRKRMSIVVRCPDGQVWLICKGADSAIIPRLRQNELAARKSQEIRRSMDVGRRQQRKSEQHEPRTSFGARPSLQVRGRSSLDVRPSFGISRVSLQVPKMHYDHRHSLQDDLQCFEDADDSTLFTRCFKHIDDFATEGLRTLLYAHKYLDEAEYLSWKKVYQEATTSLNHRQERIESAGELLEQDFDLLGASAIEDKLQKGVPETIDRLRRAGMRIWMLTGDKRETAINIAHSAQICQPSSLIYILDSHKGNLLGQMSEIVHDGDAHHVVVIDGHTLSLVTAQPDLRHIFFTVLIANIDSFIVCRASPAQKAEIVQGIRSQLPGLTLAIGDGANDIAMIQSAHVGIGISGKEGLQAARVADFSIAQFRFLQRLLLVHGRYQYVRTARFILLTFWKEMFFYMIQALYQHENGYTGTSLFENWSLTVLNTLFTSLCVIVPGIFEQDLRPATLLAIPELYIHGPRNTSLNFRLYLTWMVHATACGLVVWFVVRAAYGPAHIMGDNGLFAYGDLCFTLGILWTNLKIFMIETHYKTLIVLTSFTITVAGWFAWNAFMSGVYSNNLSPYDVKGGFYHTFGTDPIWWLTLIVVLLVLVCAESVYLAIRRRLMAARLWPPWKFTRTRRNENPHSEELELEMWQELEMDPEIKKRLEAMASSEDDGMG